MTRQQSRAGSRENRFRPGYGRHTDNKIAWLRTEITNQLAILGIEFGDTPEEDEEFFLAPEKGTSYLLVIPVPGRSRPLIWNLTGMTIEELDATRQFFDHLFNLVDPVVRERDKAADDAYENTGDDSFTRLYRALPTFIVRERPKREHGKGVHNGSQDVPERSGVQEPSDGGVRVVGDELADSPEEDSQAEDDRPAADFT